MLLFKKLTVTKKMTLHEKRCQHFVLIKYANEWIFISKKKSISYVFLSLSQKVPTIIIYVKLIKFRLENIILDKLQRVNFPTNKLFCNLSLERQVFWRTWRLGKIWQKFDPKIFFSILVAEEVDFSANSCKKNTILNSKLDF